LLDKIANSKQISDSTIDALEKERKHMIEKDEQMEQIMITRVKGMIDESTQSERLKAEKRLKEVLAKADEKLAGELAIANKRIDESTQSERLKAEKRLKEELAKADEKLKEELAKADEQLVGELAKANKRIDKLQSELHSSNDRADVMSSKLQEVDEVTRETLEWISLGPYWIESSCETCSTSRRKNLLYLANLQIRPLVLHSPGEIDWDTPKISLPDLPPPTIFYARDMYSSMIVPGDFVTLQKACVWL
jgi:hypothetical protein